MRQVILSGPRGASWRADVPSERGERMRGLRGRTLDPNQAMLLERCRSVQTIGMSFPITVALLDASWRVTRVVRLPAGRVVFSIRARHVLECHIGADVRVGDRISRARSRPRPR
jgi:uncharacterized membrane protein (UPF0127 family)